MYYKHLVDDKPESEWKYAIFDTEIDMFVTSVWSDKTIKKIWRTWETAHGLEYMARFEISERSIESDNESNKAILIVDRDTKRLVAYFHIRNRGYTTAFDKDYIFVEYTPPNGMDITEVFGRLSGELWDGKGVIVERG